jgi:hypothetical protein
LPANVILYEQLTTSSDNSYNLNAINPNGTNDHAILSNVPATINPIALDPNVKNQYVVGGAATLAGPYALYLTTGASLTGASQLVPASYALISSISIGVDGKHIVFSAEDQSSNNNLYVVAASGGTPTLLDTSESTSSLALDSDTIAYSTIPAGGLYDEIFIRSISKGTVQQITNDPTDCDFPQFSKDGTKIVFSKVDAAGNYGMAVYTLSTKTEVDLPNVNELYEQGGSFDTAGDLVSFFAEGTGNGIYTIPTSGTSNEVVVKASQAIEGGTYWTSTSGRAFGPGGTFSVSRLQKHRHP